MRFHRVNRRLSLAPSSLRNCLFPQRMRSRELGDPNPGHSPEHGLSGAELGFSLLFIALGSLIGIPLAGRLIGHYGSPDGRSRLWRGGEEP